MIQEICLDGNLTAACCKLRHSQGVKFQLTRSRSQKPDIGACEKNPPVPKVAKPKDSNARLRHLTEDEQQRLVTTTKQSANRYLPTIVTLAL